MWSVTCAALAALAAQPAGAALGKATARRLLAGDVCDPDARLRGSWNLTDTLVHSDPGYCPRTVETMRRERHGAQYMCGPDHTYRDGSFIWEETPPAASEVLVQELATTRRPLRVHFVGDSTVQQIFYAFACELERGGVLNASSWTSTGEGYTLVENIEHTHVISTGFTFSRFLRDDLPCPQTCRDAQQPMSGEHNVQTCSACDEHGNPRPVSLDTAFRALAERAGHGDASANAHAIFVGVGSWYNYHKGLYDSDVEYERTLEASRPLFATLKERGTAVLWYDIPHCGAYCDRAGRPEPAYEWSGIAAKNAAARRILGPTVQFMNISGSVIPRLAQDRIWPGGGPTDGMPHYCNPGPSSVPQFVAHATLALLRCRTCFEKSTVMSRTADG